MNPTLQNRAVPSETDGVPAAPPHPARVGPRTWGDLARLIARRTTDIVAIMLVLGAGLTFGRQSWEWLQSPPEPAPAQVAGPVLGTDWTAPGVPVDLEFGDSPWALTRQSVRGSLQQAWDTVRDQCRQVLERGPLPAAPEQPAERQLLDVAAQYAPELEQTGAWRVTRVPGGLGMLVGIRAVPGPLPEAAARDRIVCAGFVIPQGTANWTAFLLHPAAPRVGGTPAAAGPSPTSWTVPLPAESRRTLALRDPQGGRWVAFTGTGRPYDWCQHFSQQMDRTGWQTARAWTRAGHVWLVRYERTHPVPARVEIQIVEESRGGLSGLMQHETLPPPKPAVPSPAEGDPR